MKIKQLLQGVPDVTVKGSKEVEITGLSSDSTRVAPGNLFIARKGLKRDGAEFIPQATLSGAAAVLTTLYDPSLKITQIVVPYPEKLEAKLAARYYEHPSKELFVVGVTGTKGKTTSSYLIWHLLNQLSKPAGLIGGVETIIGEKRIASTLTTHDPIRNQKALREMVSAGLEAAVMEVSSHGLEQERVGEIEFDLALFTNLLNDHLDYHGTMENYAAAKKKLFDRAPVRILNADSPWSEQMAGGRAAFTYGIEAAATARATDIEVSSRGTRFTLEYRGKREPFATELIGRFNVYNLLGAIAVGLEMDEGLSTLSTIFAKTPQVPGRLERIENAKGFQLFVDHAHTGDALDNVLSTLRELTPNRLIVVFGCGGGRDRERRRGMAKAAEKWADVAIVTSDNPRHEDPNEICRQILGAFQSQRQVTLEIDRRAAIGLAVGFAKEGDIVLIAGKGHEKTQIFGSQTVPFEDSLVAKEALQSQGHSAILF
jgi:UDP-N-acetylmuramoyl-L-alanyl-D-glutamate--2,6-diaminopimelate ligase